MEATPDSFLEQATRDLAARLDRLLQELADVRAACLELARALKVSKAQRRPTREAAAGKGRLLEADELQKLAHLLRTETLDALRRRLQRYTKPQLYQLAAHIGSSAGKASAPKGELIDVLIAEARYHDEHRDLRGF